MDKHVTDIELSKRLKEAVIIGEHRLFWNYVKEWDQRELMDVGVNTGDDTSIPAYLLSELLEMVGGDETTVIGVAAELTDYLFGAKINPIQAVAEVLILVKEQK